MTDLRQATQQALEALIWADAQGENWQQVVKKAIKAIQEAAAQPEPVHDLYDEGFRRGLEMSSSYKEIAKAYKEAYFNLVKNVASMKAFEPTPPIVLYTPPAPERKPLTDGEAKELLRIGPVHAPDGVITRSPFAYRNELLGTAMWALRKAEAAHGIKENT